MEKSNKKMRVYIPLIRKKCKFFHNLKKLKPSESLMAHAPFVVGFGLLSTDNQTVPAYVRIQNPRAKGRIYVSR
jgi:hypothetical protein